MSNAEYATLISLRSGDETEYLKVMHTDKLFVLFFFFRLLFAVSCVLIIPVLHHDLNNHR